MTRDEAKMVLELIRDRYSSVDVDRLSLTDAETDAILMAIEALERKCGEWEVYKDCEGKTRVITCNLCGWESGRYTWHNYNFCPNCGAEMKND